MLEAHAVRAFGSVTISCFGQRVTPVVREFEEMLVYRPDSIQTVTHCNGQQMGSWGENSVWGRDDQSQHL